jgi:hypothetical protein
VNTRGFGHFWTWNEQGHNRFDACLSLELVLVMQHTEQYSEEKLAGLLEASEALDEDVGGLLAKCEAHSKRAVITSALCTAAFEHGLSQRILLELSLTGTALALCRLHIEAVVRATWTAECAHDEWLDKFTTPVQGQRHEEPANPVAIGQRIKHIAAKQPRVGEECALLNNTIPAMHSFVHSGAQAVMHALLPSYPTDKLVALLWNRNLLHLYTANCAVVAAVNALLVPRLLLLHEKHVACMPPSLRSMPPGGPLRGPSPENRCKRAANGRVVLPDVE